MQKSTKREKKTYKKHLKRCIYSSKSDVHLILETNSFIYQLMMIIVRRRRTISWCCRKGKAVARADLVHIDDSCTVSRKNIPLCS